MRATELDGTPAGQSEGARVQSYLVEQRVRIDAELDVILPPEDAYPSSIHRAMRYSVFAGGKRLRPILCLESGRVFGGDERALVRVAGAIELIHTYSLVHDDLPALDNDDLRRGKASCHRAFGEATAILTGDALLTLAFETLASAEGVPDGRCLSLLRDLAHAIGVEGGMIGGQVVDLETNATTADALTLEYIHRAKTGALIRAAVRAGAIVAGAPEADLDRVSNYGDKVGLAFQIVDDLLDATGTEAAAGKRVGKDARQEKLTYPSLFGVESSRRLAQELIRGACETLEPFGERGRRLREIAEFLLRRNR